MADSKLRFGIIATFVWDEEYPEGVEEVDDEYVQELSESNREWFENLVDDELDSAEGVEVVEREIEVMGEKLNEAK